MYFVCIFQIADDIFRVTDAEEDTRQKKKKLKPGEENILAIDRHHPTAKQWERNHRILQP